MKSHSTVHAARMASALADPNRLRIFQLILKRKICVCKIIPAVDLPQNLVSHHLGVLRRAGLVRFQREGTHRFYLLDRVAWRSFIRFFNTHA